MGVLDLLVGVTVGSAVSIDGGDVGLSSIGAFDGGGVGMSSMGSVRVGSSDLGSVVGTEIMVGRKFGCSEGWSVNGGVGGSSTGESDLYGAVGAGVEILTGHFVVGAVGF